MNATAPSAGRLLWPRPLPFHLGNIVWTSMATAVREITELHATPAAATPAMTPAPPVLNSDWQRRLAQVPDQVADALQGIQRYQQHPYRRQLVEPPVLWQRGQARLLDYGRGGQQGQTPVLVIPSLINRAYILDLSQRQSFLRWLAKQGLRPILLDWGAPGEAERAYDLDNYLEQQLLPAFDFLNQQCQRALPVLGYCMGGTLAVALGCHRGAQISALALLATPWDFSGQSSLLQDLLTASPATLETVLHAHNGLPVDVLQCLFAALDPALSLRKFRRFTAMDPDSDAARDFVAIEDWANDGVPLSSGVSRDCLLGWYQQNQPHLGLWQCAGRKITPQGLTMPTLLVVPVRDRIVPPQSALALAAQLSNADIMRASNGHVAMLVGPSALSRLWQPLAAWLTNHCLQA